MYMYMYVYVSGLFGISVINTRSVLAVTLEPRTSMCVKPFVYVFLKEQPGGVVEVVPGQAGHVGLKL